MKPKWMVGFSKLCKLSRYTKMLFRLWVHRLWVDVYEVWGRYAPVMAREVR